MEALINRNPQETNQTNVDPSSQTEKSTPKNTPQSEPDKKANPKPIRAYESLQDRWQ